VLFKRRRFELLDRGSKDDQTDAHVIFRELEKGDEQVSFQGTDVRIEGAKKTGKGMVQREPE